MASAFITTRRRRAGLVFVVRYRVGGRTTPLLHAGTFASLSEAERARAAIADRLAAANPPTAEQQQAPLVYFARLGSLVKIGISIDPAERCRHLNAELLGTEDGGRARERELHGRFAEARESGEWFWATDELLAYIARLEEAAA